MFHREEWYTCDRCSEKIENLIDDVVNCLPEEVKKDIPREDYLKISSGEADISMVNPQFNDDGTETITIRRVFLKKDETIHLCHKCKKDFERFMRNE